MPLRLCQCEARNGTGRFRYGNCGAGAPTFTPCLSALRWEAVPSHPGSVVDLDPFTENNSELLFNSLKLRDFLSNSVPCQANILAHSSQLSHSKHNRVSPQVRGSPPQLDILKVEGSGARVQP